MQVGFSEDRLIGIPRRQQGLSTSCSYVNFAMQICLNAPSIRLMVVLNSGVESDTLDSLGVPLFETSVVAAVPVVVYKP